MTSPTMSIAHKLLTGLRPTQIQLLLFFADYEDGSRQTPPPPTRLANYRALRDRGLIAPDSLGHCITDLGLHAAAALKAEADENR